MTHAQIFFYPAFVWNMKQSEASRLCPLGCVCLEVK